MGFLRMTEVAHRLLEERINNGDVVVDATAGNGHDTVFLARLVGDKGKVHAYDIQEQALTNTRKKLQEQNLSHRVILHHASHTEIALLDTSIKAAVFNLGYLPGSDKSIVTQPETTAQAVDGAISLLTPGGIVVIVVYRGHEGGDREGAVVERLLGELSPSHYKVLKYAYINMPNNPPYLLAVEKNR